MIHARKLVPFVVPALLVAGGLVALGAVGDRPQAPREIVGLHGLAEPLTLDQLVDRATLVVVGTPSAAVERRFTANQRVPDSEKADPIYRAGSYAEYPFAVAEYVKGSGPATLPVRILADTTRLAVGGEDQPRPAGGRQVLLLFEGTGVWAGGWLILGPNGVAPETGGAFAFPSGDAVTVEQLREYARG